MENNFSKMGVAKPSVVGSTTINHAARIQLELTMAEYVLMDYISRAVRDKKSLDLTEVYIQTGMIEETQSSVLNNLVQKGFIIGEQVNPPKITDKWESAFTNMEKEFEEMFWRLNGKVFFTGSRKKSYEFYYKLRKKYSRTFVIDQRNAYADYLEMEKKRGFNRAVMMAERWLNPSNEYYLADWKSQANEIRKSISSGVIAPVKSMEKIEKAETVTSEERRLAYEQDSNQ